MSKTKNELITLKGKVVEALNHLQYRVELENGHTLLCYSAGKMRKFRIRILTGDTVTVEVSPYDLTNGRIVYRH